MSKIQPNSSAFRVGHINIRSLRNKVSEVSDIVSRYQLQILAVSETWLSKDISDDEVSIQGFRLFRTDRVVSEERNGRPPGGGVCLYVRDSLCATDVPVSLRPDFPRLELVLIRVKLSCLLPAVIVGCTYRPPSAPACF